MLAKNVRSRSRAASPATPGIIGLAFLISGMVAAAYGFSQARKNHGGKETRKASPA
jgi:hypothetical protein